MAKTPSKTTRIKRLVQDISSEYMEEAKRLAEEIIFIQDKLDDAREEFKDDGLITEYDNGGGQTGTRENPALNAYQKLLKSYITVRDSLEKLRDNERHDKELIGLFDWMD